MKPEEVPLVPRRVLFGNPDRESVRVSPDGTRLAWLAPVDGVLNVWVAPRGNLALAKPVTRDTGRGVRTYLWAYTSDHILYLQDKGGDENWRLYCADLHGGESRDLTPLDGVQARIVEASHKHPREIVVGLNNRDPQWHDVHRLDILTGRMTLLLQHDRFMEVLVDDEYRVRCAVESLPDGGKALFLRSGDEWTPWETIAFDDSLTTGVLGFARTNRVLLMTDSRGRDTAALVEVDPATKEKKVLAADPKVDAGEVFRHPSGRQPLAVAFTYTRKRWQVIDKSIQPDFDHLATLCEGEFSVESKSQDNGAWVVRCTVDTGPARFHLYDRGHRSAEFLFSNRHALEDCQLAKMHSVVVEARDGLSLVCYYTLPLGTDRHNPGLPEKPLPTMLVPHGGPWGRDLWGFNPGHQWLANRGYAVLSVNFRSSTGFGKTFINAGNHEWGRRVLHDQEDAVRWAVSEGIADPERVGVYGGSFGGYSALAGLAFTPGLFACGVDLVGPANLITLLETIPAYWKPHIELFTARAGDHRTEEGRALLKEHSPLTQADRIIRPLLIAHGANDPRVKQSESEQIVAALKGRDVPVTYLLYPDEGHGFARPENNLSFRAVAEAFLAKWLGGTKESFGHDFDGSSVQVPVGAEHVPGLAEELRFRARREGA